MPAFESLKSQSGTRVEDGSAGPAARWEQGIYRALLALLVWVPFVLGGIHQWSGSAAAVMEVWVFLLLAAWLALWALGRVRIAEPLRRAWPALVLLGVWLAHIAITIVPLPVQWVAFLSPESARMHALAQMLGAQERAITISVDPNATQVALAKSLAYCAVFFLFLALVNSRSRVQTAATVILYAAVVHATYAVVAHLTGFTRMHLGFLISPADSASGFYNNRNHFAGMLEMTLAIGIGLLIAGLSEGRAHSWRKFFVQLIDWMLSPRFLQRLSLCVLVIALTTTHSRMGNSAFFASLLIAGAIGIALSRLATRKTVILLASLVVLDLAIVGSWFGVEKLAARLEATTTGDVRDREEPGAYTLALIRDYPVFGAGAGSFYAAFPRFQPEAIGYYWDEAHNDYAQFAAETGVVGLGLLGLVISLSLGAAVRAQWTRRDPLMRGMSFASIMGVTSILIHSWVDFNLQVPANAALFMVLLALGWISLWLRRSS